MNLKINLDALSMMIFLLGESNMTIQEINQKYPDLIKDLKEILSNCQKELVKDRCKMVLEIELEIICGCSKTSVKVSFTSFQNRIQKNYDSEGLRNSNCFICDKPVFIPNFEEKIRLVEKGNLQFL